MAKTVPPPPPTKVRGVPPTHFCHATDCRTEIPQDVFFCAAHYGQLPAMLKEKVGSAQKSGVGWLVREGKDWAEAVNSAQRWLEYNAGSSV